MSQYSELRLDIGCFDTLPIAMIAFNGGIKPFPRSCCVHMPVILTVLLPYDHSHLVYSYAGMIS